MAGVDHLVEFANWLSTNGCGVQGKSLFVNVIPTQSTGPAVFVLEVPSPAPVVLQSTSYIRRPRFRIDTRSTGPGPGTADYPDITNARNLAQKTWAACMALGNTRLHSTGITPHSSGNWLFAIPEQEPYLAGRDDSNRVVFSFVVGCERQGP